MQTIWLVIISFYKNRRNLVLLMSTVFLIPLLLLFNTTMLEKEQTQRITLLKSDPNASIFAFVANPQKELKQFSNELEFDSAEYEQTFSDFHNREINYVRYIQTKRAIPLDIENKYLSEYQRVNELSELIDQKKLYLPSEYIQNKVIINNKLLEEGLEEVSLRYGQTGVGFTNFLIQLLCSFPGIFLLLFIFGMGFGDAFENHNIRLIVSQPIKNRNYLASNLLWTYFASILFVIFLLLLAYTLGTIFFGQGSSDYPVYISSGGESYFIPIWKYWYLLFGTFCVVHLFYILVFFCFSVFLKKGVIALIATMSLLIGLNTLFTQGALGQYDYLNPFIYLNPVKLFVGLDFSNIELKSAGFSNGSNLFLSYKLFIQNVAYFEGSNLSTILNQHLTIKDCLIPLIAGSFILKLLLCKLMKWQDY